MVRRLATGFLAGVFLIGSWAPAQSSCCNGAEDKPAAEAPAEPPEPVEGEAAPSEEAPEDATDSPVSPSIADPSFDKHFELTRFGAAWYAMDAEMLTDCALDLAEAERIYQRQHIGGITSDKVLLLCVKMASETQNKEALERLAAVAAQRKDEQLAAMADAALKVSGEARAAAPSLKVAIDDRTSEQFEAVKAVVERIKLAKIAGDSGVLQEIAANLADSSSFSDEENTYLSKMAADAAESSRGGDMEAVDPTVEALSLLESGGRDSNRNAVRANVEAGGWYVVWGVELNEGEYAKFIASVAASVVTANPGWIQAYFKDYLNRTYTKFKAKLPGIAQKAFVETAAKAMKSRGKTFNIGKVGIRGGIATYNNWQIVSYNEPRTRMVEKCKKVLGKKICTKVPEVYTVRVEKKVSLPNKHQPYFAFRPY
jgi:hypothetical protein